MRFRKVPGAELPRTSIGAEERRDFEEVFRRIRQAAGRRSGIASTLDYARGNGNDDTADLQRAMDENPSLYWAKPPSFYKVSDTLKYPSGARYYGAGAQHARVVADMAKAIFAPAVAAAIDVVFMGIGLDNTTQATAGGIGIDLYDVEDALIEGVWAKRLATGIRSDGRVTYIDLVGEEIGTGLFLNGGEPLIVAPRFKNAVPAGTGIDAANATGGLLIHGAFSGLTTDVNDPNLVLARVHADGRLWLPDGADGSPALSFLRDGAIGIRLDVAGAVKKLALEGDLLIDGDIEQLAGQKIGFHGATPVVRPGAYTLTHGGADRTLAAAPAVGGGTYTGLADGEAGTPYAAVADLDSLSGDVGTLSGAVANMADVLAQLVADFQARGDLA